MKAYVKSKKLPRRKIKTKVSRYHIPLRVPSTHVVSDEQLQQWQDDYGDMLIMHGYNDCILGISDGSGREPHIIYDYEKVIKHSMDDGMTYQESAEHFDHNQRGPYMGDRTPTFLVRPNLEY